MDFEWDVQKARANLAKHQVSFEEAQTVFTDPFALIFDDEWQSAGEPREIIIGHSAQNRLLLVSFTERPGGLIRIISSRETTRSERIEYEENI